MANGLIFVIFVKKVRQKLCLFKCFDCKTGTEKTNIGAKSENTPLIINSGDTDPKFHNGWFTPTNSLTE